MQYLMNQAVLVTLIASTGLIACVGCGQTQTPTTPAVQGGPTGPDPLADILRLANDGDPDSAIERFVSYSENWVESTSLEEFQLSEAAFGALDRNERSRLQQQFIDRVSDIKGFARTVIDRAKEAKKQGDEDTAQRYLKAVNRLGEQLRDSDTVLVFQLTGKALANATLDE